MPSGFFERRTPEYDYDIPSPGSYTLPVIQSAADGTVLGTDGQSVRLHDLVAGRVVILSFIYTRCTDPRACLRATGVLREVQSLSAALPGVADRLLLLTLSFDPAHDRPEVMKRYGRVSLEKGQGAEWLFLTTRSPEDLAPLLDAYGQRVNARKTFSPLGPYQHNLRVYLIDGRQQVRNIYSYGLLDPRLVVADVQTVLLEARDAVPTAGSGGASPGR